MLRIDVTGPIPYAVPPDNPFVGKAGARPEIWATGLRNPWRFSFDRDTGDLFIADVGQDSIEEVNFQPAASSGGENYGWRRMEGSQCFNPSFGCDNSLLTLPVLEYDHTMGCSVTGGYRYRGMLFPGLTGLYFFADYCTGIVWGAQDDETGDWTDNQLKNTNLMISTFGEDEDGEIYLAHLAAAPNGAIYRLSTLVPGAPGDLRATVAASSQIDLNWTDNASGEDGFRVVRKIGSQGIYVEVATLAANTIAYQDTGLAPGNTFHYRVQAFNAQGDSAFSTPASAVLPSDGSGGCFIAVLKAGFELGERHKTWNRQ